MDGISILVPMNTVWFKLLSDWGYSRAHKKESAARGCVMFVQEAFIHLMALTTFYIAKRVGPDPDHPE
jgi:hypothetical protein